MPLDIARIALPSDALTLRRLLKLGTIAEQGPELDTLLDAERRHAELAYAARQGRFDRKRCAELMEATALTLVDGYQRFGLAENEHAAKEMVRALERTAAIEVLREECGRPGYGR